MLARSFPPRHAFTMTLRGVELVDAVMAFRRDKGAKLEPTPERVLSNLSLGDRPLTPSLRRWLEHDGDMFTLLDPVPIRAMLEATYFVDWAESFFPLETVLTAPCALFDGWGADSRRFLYLGEPDEFGEYPVFTLDTDDAPLCLINGPVDVWIAQQAGYLEAEHVYGHVPSAYACFRDDHAKRNFGGRTMVEGYDLAAELALP